MSYESCPHGNQAPQYLIDSVKESQAHPGRHCCAICSYVHGLRDGKDGTDPRSHGELTECKHGEFAPYELMDSLPPLQGGIGRHKCVICSYAFGYKTGIAQRNDPHNQIINRLNSQGYSTDSALELTTNVPSTKRTKPNKSSRTNIDYAKRDAQNKELGLAGEILVMQYEKKRLTDVGREDLAELIEHTSVIKGDGEGYDIKSFDDKGNSRFIEVKSTTASLDTPFYITKNEVEFSKNNHDKYFLYRVHKYDKTNGSGELFIYHGDVRADLKLEPQIYKTTIKD